MPTGSCLRCGRERPLFGRVAKEVDKALCSVCEDNPRRDECASCGVRALGDDAGRCRRCRQREERRCARCDRAGPRTWRCEAWLCGSCALRAAFDAEVAPPEQLPAALVPLRDAVVATENWKTTLSWIRHSVGGQLLGRLARGELPITHETLERATEAPNRSVSHLRDLLVSTGVLPEAPERSMERYEEFVADRLGAATVDPADAKVARAWSRWAVMPALRIRAGAGEPMAQPLNRSRANLRAVIALLEVLAGRGRNLRSTTQADIDGWFSQPGHGAWRMRPFLVWAGSRRHLPPGLRLPVTPARGILSPIDHEARWQVARHLVADDTLPTDRRVAAGLLVLYGQTLTRIGRLTTGDVHRAADGSVILVLGGNPMPIHEPFATLVGRLPLQRTNGVSDQVRGRHWLFPGRRAGQPVGTNALAGWMRELGIETRSMRNTARAQLAGEIPAGVLAEILGVNAATATRWTAVANGNWAAYVAIRTASR